MQTMFDHIHDIYVFNCYSVKQFIVQKQQNVYSLQRYLGSPSISVENREFYSYSLQFEL